MATRHEFEPKARFWHLHKSHPWQSKQSKIVESFLQLRPYKLTAAGFAGAEAV